MSDPTKAPAAGDPPRLLEQVRNAIRRRHYSYRTEQAYIHWIKRFIWFHGKRHPGEMGAAEVTAFLTHLARERDVSASTQNQPLSSLLFLYGQVLQVDARRVGAQVSERRPAVGLAVRVPVAQALGRPSERCDPTSPRLRRRAAARDRAGSACGGNREAGR